MTPTLTERLFLEARQERVCDTCGGIRDHVRVYRKERRNESYTQIVGRMQFVCFNCQPEFVVNPWEPWDRPVLLGANPS